MLLAAVIDQLRVGSSAEMIAQALPVRIFHTHSLLEINPLVGSSAEMIALVQTSSDLSFSPKLPQINLHWILGRNDRSGFASSDLSQCAARDQLRWISD